MFMLHQQFDGKGRHIHLTVWWLGTLLFVRSSLLNMRCSWALISPFQIRINKILGYRFIISSSRREARERWILSLILAAFYDVFHRWWRVSHHASSGRQSQKIESLKNHTYTPILLSREIRASKPRPSPSVGRGLGVNEYQIIWNVFVCALKTSPLTLMHWTLRHVI